MFCKKCGAQISDDATFCPECGYNLKETSAPTHTQSPTGVPETLVVEVQKEDETVTINRYTKFGWRLTNNQEVNITSVHGGGSTVNGNGSTIVTSSTKTYIKLTFERNTGMPNFEMLDGLYQKFKGCMGEKSEIQADIAKRGNLSAKFILIVTAIIGIPLTLYFEPLFRVLTWDYDISFLSVFEGALIGLSIGVVLALIANAIKTSVDTKKLRKHYAPRLAELEREMDTLANEAAKYL